MGQIVVDVGSFDLTSHNGNTAYSSIRYFDIPANAGITSCVATFATHVNTGNFQGKSFSLNGTQAHPNTPWPTSGIALNTALLSTGQNTFRAAIKSQAGLSARWSIGTIYLTISYNDVSGGGGGSYIGGVSVNKTYAEITGGDAITVTCPAQSGYWHYVTWGFGSLSGYWSHGWGAGGVINLTPALNWAEQIPNAVSGALNITVRVYNTPAEPHNLVSELVFTVTLGVPYWMAPSITAFDAARIVNNTPPSISDYVQNVSGVSLAVSGISGSYGSSIVSCVISGGGFSLNGTSGNISRLPNVGNVDFTAEVTDSRGRKAYKSLNINVLAYTPITVSSVTAFRSNASKTPADEGLFATLKAAMIVSSLNGQNAGTVNGRVYEKGTTAPGWTTMADNTLVLFGGSLSIEKAYTAEISINDLITSYQYSIDIPTATVTMGIAADGDGVSFGMYPEVGKLKSAWPIVAPNFYPVGAIYISISGTSPATLFGGTWSALPTGKFLRVGTGGTEGGSDTHVHSLSSGYAMIGLLGAGYIHMRTKATPAASYETYIGGSTYTYASNNGGRGVELGGTADSASNVPAYYGVYAWRRTA